MNVFSYTRAADIEDALVKLSKSPNAKFLGGGTNLVDLMREGIETPDELIDVTRLPLDQIEERSDGSISIGATARNTAVARHRAIRERYPVLAQAILFGASGQIRNMATVGGNLMQRTRCPYFYDSTAHCNKRRPGSGCDALEGFNRMHAVLGASPNCIATHPSDLCVALAALDAQVFMAGPGYERSISFNDFHLLPAETPHIETQLRAGELITRIEIPPLELARRSLYRKVRDRASYAFALVSVAAALHVDNGVIRDVRLAVGGVAHKPWRAYLAEEILVGAPADHESFRRAAEAEMASARGLSHNAFKIELAMRTIVNVFTELSDRTQPGETP